MEMPDTNQSALDFWEEVYRAASPESGGRPSAVLERFVSGRTPGTALDLGCAKGDDAVWLAKQGWSVTAVDISPTVLGYARANAARCGVENRIDFQQHDLTLSFPRVRCDLVCAMFLQTPIAFDRVPILVRAAETLRTGGLLLVVTHGSVAPWSWAKADSVFPTPRESLEQLELTAADWEEIFVGSSSREATGPEGQRAKVSDTIVALERR
ncbi:MAG: class I SAM-dependent methyltransferase [Pseudomonadota bacterium]